MFTYGNKNKKHYLLQYFFLTSSKSFNTEIHFVANNYSKLNVY